LPVPVFFAITGIRTRLDLAHGSGIWLDLILVVFVATTSKWAGTTLGGRVGGAPWRTALWLGALMNTRGLVELIVLNAGMERGILSPELFSIMVSMALFTTFLTAPLLDWIGATSRSPPIRTR
jgi:Kef-type K+ transport system membrane component KefB